MQLTPVRKRKLLKADMAQRTLTGYFGVVRRDGPKRRIVVVESSDDDAPLVRRSAFLDDEAVEDSGGDDGSGDDDDSFVVSDHVSVSSSNDSAPEHVEALRSIVANLRNRRRFMRNDDCPQCVMTLRLIVRFIDKVAAVFP